MWRSMRVAWLLDWLRSLSTSIRRSSGRAAQRSATSALHRFTMAEVAAAISLVALAFALIVTRKLLTPRELTQETQGVTSPDAGVSVQQDLVQPALRGRREEPPVR
jgi:hypothetical protein